MRSNQAKHKTAPKGSQIFRRAIVVMLTLALSIACYGVTVFAWFQSELLNTGNTITSGTYSLAVTVVEKDNTNTSVQETNGSFALTAGEGYTVTITAEGTTKGYCKISNGTDTWNTEAISGGETFTLTIYPAVNASYIFKTVWGAPQGDVNLTSGAEIGEPPAESQEEPEVPVEDGITQPGDDVTNPAETDPTTAPTEGETTAPTEEPTTTPTEEPTPTETVTETTQPTVQETPAEGEQ